MVRGRIHGVFAEDLAAWAAEEEGDEEEDDDDERELEVHFGRLACNDINIDNPSHFMRCTHQEWLALIFLGQALDQKSLRRLTIG